MDKPFEHIVIDGSDGDTISRQSRVIVHGATCTPQPGRGAALPVVPSGRSVRILVDSGADEHVCPTDVAPGTLLRPTKGVALYGTRTAYLRLGPEGQSVDAEFSFTIVTSPILSWRKLVRQGPQFEAGPAGCKMSKGDRSVTLDDVKTFLVDVRAYTAVELKDADARLVAPVVS